VTGVGNAAKVAAHLRRFALRDDIEVVDVTEETRLLAIVGPLAREAATAAGIGALASFEIAPASVAAAAFALGHDGWSADGISVIVPSGEAAAAEESLLDAVRSTGGAKVGPRAAEAWRILRGLPASGGELTEEHNPLEAGLWDAVSFTKGCYVGQEVVARLNTYDKVSRVLAGLVLPEGAPVPIAGSEVRAGSRPGGAVSSAVVPPGRKAPVALAFLKRDLPADAPLEVSIEGATFPASRSDLPFGPTP
jgi:folate-binding protein YgfZ